jgi:opacity protein-like surface antigen
MKRRFAIPLFLILALVLVVPASAQTSGGGAGLGWEGWGVRVGASSDPDQVYGGFHFEMGHFAEDVRFRPTIELGVGDDVTLLQALAEVHYVFSKVQVWKPYVGGGIGLSHISLDDVPPQVDDSDTDIALMGIGGVETSLKSAARFFLELKIGFGDDDPDFKVGLGWTWR